MHIHILNLNRNAFLTTFLGLYFCILLGQAQGETGESAFFLFPLSDSHNPNRIIREITNGEKIPPGTYKIRSQLSLKTKNFPVKTKSGVFKWPQSDLPSLESDNKIWTSKSQSFIFKPGQPFLPIPLKSHSYHDKEIPITDAHKLYIDYKDLVPMTPFPPQVRMILSTDKPKRYFQVIAGGRLVTLDTLEVATATWEKKGNIYLIKRELDTPLDDKWYYIQKEFQTVFQRRLNTDLSELDFLDFFFSSNTDLNRWKINFRTKSTGFWSKIKLGFPDLSFTSNPDLKSWGEKIRTESTSFWSKTKIIPFRDLPKEIITLKNQQVLRIHIKEYLKIKFRGNLKKQSLQEIIVFTNEKLPQVLKDRPLKKILLKKFFLPNLKEIEKSGNSKVSFHKTYLFPLEIQTLPNQDKRLILDLKKIKASLKTDAKLISLTLQDNPESEKLKSKSGLRLLSAMTVTETLKPRPTFFQMGEKLNKRWGGPFFNPNKLFGNKTEWVQVLEYFPFLSPENHQKDPFLIREDTGEVIHVLKKPTGSLKFGGIQFQAHQVFSEWNYKKNGLQLKGKGNWIEFDWPVQLKPSKSTRLFIALDNLGNNILDIQAIPASPTQRFPSISLQPNRPQTLNIPSKEINKFIIRINFHKSRFHLELKEIAVFDPIILSDIQALDAPILMEDEIPVSSHDRVFNLNQNLNLVKESNPLKTHSLEDTAEKLSWITRIDRKVNWIRGLKLNFKVPPAFHVNNPCWLQIHLVGSRHEHKLRLCPEISVDQILLPGEKLFQGSEFFPNEIVKHIKWQVFQKSNGNSSQDILPIEIMGTLFSYDIRTMRSNLNNHPVLIWNDKPLYFNSQQSILGKELISNNIWTKLDTISINNDSKLLANYKFGEHPQLLTQNVILEKTSPFRHEDILNLNKNPLQIKTEDSPFLKFFVFPIIIGLIGWGLYQWKVFSRSKWLINLSPEFAKKQIRYWLSISAGFYSLAILGWAMHWENYYIYLSFAGLTVVLAWRSFIWNVRPTLESRRPDLADQIYRRAGAPYLAGFYLSLLITILVFMVGLKFIAEQIGIISYYLLVLGVFLEAKTLLKKYSAQPMEDQLITSDDKAARA